MGNAKRVCTLLDEAIKDEKSAKGFYGRLIKALDREYPRELGDVARAAISTVAWNEQSHYRLLKNLRVTLCKR